MESVSLKGRKVLVTGAGGFIGSHLAERLAEEGAEVRAMVHYNALGRSGWLDESARSGDMEIVAGDVTDTESVFRHVEGREIVFHLAALIGIPYSYVAPRSYLRTNIEGTLNVLEACRRVGVERLLQTSTSEVYGTAQYVPIDEKHPLQGQSPYSASKIAADKMVEAFAASYALRVVTVRPFNTFGPRQSRRAVIPTIISQLLAGDAVRLGSLSPRRDLNYVTNTVAGFVAAAEATNVAGEAVNFGSGSDISIGELVGEIGRLMGKTPVVESEPARVRPEGSEVERLLADNAKAKSLTGWAPTVSLQDGLQRTIDWLRTRPVSDTSRYFL